MLSDLKILDPIWTTAYIVRDHGYMVYDTLLAMDAELKVKPQMAESWKVSDDKLTYTFVLRDGLKFHDGAPVTAEDCVASIKRWGARDAMGQKLMQFTRELAVVDAKTFTLTLKEPFGMVLEALGKPCSSVPFIMPKRIAETPPDKQVSEFIGSGPFVFKKEQWRPGEKVVYEKFADYKPRPEPPSGLAGGKQVFVDRVEWVVLPDAQTAVNALIAGEIDMMQQPPFDMLPLLESEQGHQGDRPQHARHPLRLPLQHPAQAVRRPAHPRRRALCAEPEGFARRRRRQSEVREGVQGRCSAAARRSPPQGLGGQAERRCAPSRRSC